MRKNYEWSKLIEKNRVKAVRNYMASDDWVVALFPHFFEKMPIKCFGNDLGGAGFYGFDDAKVENDAKVKNVGPITGQHSAFASEVDSIAKFLLPNGSESDEKVYPETNFPVLNVASFFCIVIWMLLAVLIIWSGFYIALSSPSYTLVVAFAYAVVIVWLLRTI